MITQYQVDIGLGYPLVAPCGCSSNYLDIMTSYMQELCCSWSGFSALVPGSDWEIGLKAEQLVVSPLGVQSIQAVDLTGATALFTMKIMESDPAGFTRRSDEDLPDILPATPQIGFDDQTVDNGLNGVSGKGWMRLRFAHTEQLSLIPFGVANLNVYDLRIRTAADQVFTLVRGRFEVIRSISREL